MMKKVLITIASLLWATSMVAAPAIVSAQTDVFGLDYGASTGLGRQDTRETASNIIRIALGFLGIVAVVIVLYGGVLWMTAAGDPGNVDKAKTVLRAGIIGLIIVLSAFAIAQFVLDSLRDATGLQA